VILTWCLSSKRPVLFRSHKDSYAGVSCFICTKLFAKYFLGNKLPSSVCKIGVFGASDGGFSLTGVQKYMTFLLFLVCC